MEKHWPILAFFDRKITNKDDDDNDDESETVLTVMESYCKDIDKFVCGYSNKGEEDY